MESAAFTSLPDELLLIIFEHCELESLLNLSMACKRFYICMDKDNFWKHRLQLLFRELDISLKTKPRSGYNYKSACIRFCGVFNSLNIGMWCECVRCQGIFCSSSCIQDSDEVIIFDFGSKTTWFKYASESTGQLSMHPTVTPSPLDCDHSRTDSGNHNIYESCPVCCRMFQNRTSIDAVRYDDKTNVLKTEHTSRRITSAFSRLAMRHFPSCFDSGDIADDVLPLSTDLAQSDHRAVGLASNSGDNMLSTSVADTQNVNLENVVDVNETKHTMNLPSTSNVQVSQCSSQSCQDNSAATDSTVTTYRFLIMHMLKRNPFFQARCIPFVLCEPTNSSHAMKVQLLQFLFNEIKVPGVCYIPKPVATALYSGLDTCLVVDSGANNTVVSAVVDQTVLDHCVQSKPIGGTFLTKRLRECIKMKGIDFEVDEANLDSSQVKRECHVAYCVAAETRKTSTQNTIHVKGYRNGILEYQHVSLGPELYLACEELYLNLDLPSMIKQAVQSLDAVISRKLLSNIVLTGGNSRLNGLSLRLTKDLKQLLPEYQSIIRVVDPRLMTGRTDAVIGASYIKKWFDASWITRQDYILLGPAGSLEKSLSVQIHCV